MYVYTMMGPNDLETRLERLAAETDTCSLTEFQHQATTLRDDPTLQQALTQATALANEKRLTTLALLTQHDSLCACEIQAALDCTNATVSHHMSHLENAGLIHATQRGKWKHYTLTPQAQTLLDQVLG